MHIVYAPGLMTSELTTHAIILESSNLSINYKTKKALYKTEVP